MFPESDEDIELRKTILEKFAKLEAFCEGLNLKMCEPKIESVTDEELDKIAEDFDKIYCKEE